jgi:XTP/dITP diphosphohydrolase
MPTLFPPRLLIATHNAGKVKEFAVLLNQKNLELVNAGDLGLAEPEETGTTFAENALLKARAGFAASGIPCLADDSGLAVDALDGAPGIYSARWAGPQKDFSAAMARVEKELLAKTGAATGAKAAFVCCLALILADGQEIIVEGHITGTLSFPPRGDNGFGYDPLFIPDHETRTYAEMSTAEKKQTSHRAKAVQELLRKFP